MPGYLDHLQTSKQFCFRAFRGYKQISSYTTAQFLSSGSSFHSPHRTYYPAQRSGTSLAPKDLHGQEIPASILAGARSFLGL
mmetsp:Transcript_14192/g.10247  ORF Transcript_14192/g.10247 Transcript_14192/m.10247 type:complete len:82 (-) Transcript_14192:282-527(-)